jgi:hypothetical protein
MMGRSGEVLIPEPPQCEQSGGPHKAMRTFVMRSRVQERIGPGEWLVASQVDRSPGVNATGI